jgi:lipoprotein-anchoring transpeptidase ErfK/SrfK
MGLPGVGFCATKGWIMRLLAAIRIPRSLLAFPLLAAMLVCPVSAWAETDPPAAQTESVGATEESAAATEQAESDSAAAADEAADKAESDKAKPALAAAADEAADKAESDKAESDKAGEKAKSDPAVDKAESDKAESDTANKQTGADILIAVDKGQQQMTVWVDGIETHSWPVSTGLRGYSTPSGNFSVSSMNKMWHSRQWDNAPMPHAIFFTKRGHAIHGSNETKRLGSAASHGCVRLSPKNAGELFTLVNANGMENVKVVLSGTTPGGESKIATPSRPEFQPERGYEHPWFGPGYVERPRRRYSRRGRWFRPYAYDRARDYPPPGYYRPRRRQWYRGY